jgi:hypothetical protein
MKVELFSQTTLAGCAYWRSLAVDIDRPQGIENVVFPQQIAIIIGAGDNRDKQSRTLGTQPPFKCREYWLEEFQLSLEAET